MPRKPTVKKIPVVKKEEEVLVLHDCTKETEIEEMCKKLSVMSVLLTGNGDPEHGLLRRVAIIGERQGEVLKKIEDVHISLKDYHKEIDDTKELASTVKSAFEKYKSEIFTAEAIREKERQERRSRLLKNIEVGSFIVAAIGLIITAYFSIVGSTQSHENATAIKTNSKQLKAIENTVGVDTTAKKDTLKIQ